MSAPDPARIAAEAQKPPKVLSGRGTEGLGALEAAGRVLDLISFVPTRKEVQGGGGVGGPEEESGEDSGALRRPSQDR